MLVSRNAVAPGEARVGSPRRPPRQNGSGLPGTASRSHENRTKTLGDAAPFSGAGPPRQARRHLSLRAGTAKNLDHAQSPVTRLQPSLRPGLPAGVQPLPAVLADHLHRRLAGLVVRPRLGGGMADRLGPRLGRGGLLDRTRVV